MQQRPGTGFLFTARPDLRSGYPAFVAWGSRTNLIAAGSGPVAAEPSSASRSGPCVLRRRPRSQGLVQKSCGVVEFARTMAAAVTVAADHGQFVHDKRDAGTRRSPCGIPMARCARPAPSSHACCERRVRTGRSTVICSGLRRPPQALACRAGAWVARLQVHLAIPSPWRPATSAAPTLPPADHQHLVPGRRVDRPQACYSPRRLGPGSRRPAARSGGTRHPPALQPGRPSRRRHPAIPWGGSPGNVRGTGMDWSLHFAALHRITQGAAVDRAGDLMSSSVTGRFHPTGVRSLPQMPTAPTSSTGWSRSAPRRREPPVGRRPI